MLESKEKKELEEFISSWRECRAKETFMKLRALLETLQDVELNFKARPGISYSLRAKHLKQKDRPLFVMIDVIDDNEDNRWLSICFYQDLISDPEEKGDLIPQGLMGEDGYCFDLEEYEEREVSYIEERIKEAYTRASTCA